MAVAAVPALLANQRRRKPNVVIAAVSAAKKPISREPTNGKTAKVRDWQHVKENMATVSPRARATEYDTVLVYTGMKENRRVK